MLTSALLAANDNDYGGWEIFLFIVAAFLFVAGVVQLLQGQWLFGIVLFVLACLVGPGGVSLLS